MGGVLELPLIARVGRWCAVHSRRLIAIWLLVVALASLPCLRTDLQLTEIAEQAGLSAVPGQWTLLAMAVPVVLGVLVVLGSPLLMMVSVLFTGTVVATTAGTLVALSTTATLTPLAWTVALLVSALVAVDHVLFACRRHQEAVATGYDTADSAQVVALTAGSTAAVSGSAVALSMAGLALFGDKSLMAVAAATLVAVVISTGASLTLLPALLASVRGSRRQWAEPPVISYPSRLPKGARFATMATAFLAVGGAALFGLWQLVQRETCVNCEPLVDSATLVGLGLLPVAVAAVLLIAFRPVLVALYTAVLTALSVLAALGIVIITMTPVPDWAPMTLLVVLTASATDVHVYLLHQLRGAALQGMSPRNGAAHGMRLGTVAAGGALLVTSGMWLVWGLLTTGDMRAFCLTTAAVLAVDTLLIRLLVLPAAQVALGGRLNWWRRRVTPPAGGR